jgi:hypothetical protein
MLHMTNDSALFQSAAECEAAGGLLDGNVYRSADDRAWLPLYEAKMMHHFTHRWGDYAMRAPGSLDSQLPDISARQLANPSYVVQPRYWVAVGDVDKRLRGWDRSWLMGFRDICRNTDERTVIAAVVPRAAIGNNLPLLLPAREPRRVAFLAASLTSFALDYCARFKVGGTHLNFFIAEQLPVLPPETYDKPTPWQPDVNIAEWLGPRILELTYTAWDLKGFAADLGHTGQPFRWDDQRRPLLRTELDACFFHLYGLERDDVDYIMDTFPIVRRNDEAAHGEYRTKRLILERFDAMAKASISGEPYGTVLVPPPADPTVAHPPES